MANSMELNKAAQARSDAASQAARASCLIGLQRGGVDAENMLQHAMTFDARRTAMFVERLMQNGDTTAFRDGISAIHGQIARSCLERKESPDNSPLIAGGTFGGLR